MTSWETVYGHLSAILVQTVPSDDQIIIGHVREACEIAKTEWRKERREEREKGSAS